MSKYDKSKFSQLDLLFKHLCCVVHKTFVRMVQFKLLAQFLVEWYRCSYYNHANPSYILIITLVQCQILLMFSSFTDDRVHDYQFDNIDR